MSKNIDLILPLLQHVFSSAQRVVKTYYYEASLAKLVKDLTDETVDGNLEARQWLSDVMRAARDLAIVLPYSATKPKKDTPSFETALLIQMVDEIVQKDSKELLFIDHRGYAWSAAEFIAQAQENVLLCQEYSTILLNILSDLMARSALSAPKMKGGTARKRRNVEGASKPSVNENGPRNVLRPALRNTRVSRKAPIKKELKDIKKEPE